MAHDSNRSRGLIGLQLAVAGALALWTLPSQAAVPGIQGPSFALVASDAYTIQPDGSTLYSWGYGCPAGAKPTFLPAQGVGDAAPVCPAMQSPGPTLIVTQGQTVTVSLQNILPNAAGPTSILFPGFQVTTSCDGATVPAGNAKGLLTCEAIPGATVTYTFTATNPGTYAYYSGTQSELQIEMGMFGAVIVLPSTIPANCTAKNPQSLAAAAYGNPGACYDREYLFQFSEADGRVHQAVDDAVHANPTGPAVALNVPMDPYQPQFFMVNGRSMPDDMDAPYAAAYLHQPYNGNPHMHPSENVLMRIIGQGRIQHPFHFHGNHARVLARDGNLLLAPDGTSLAGPLLFTTPTVPGQTQDQIFTWTGQGLNWDPYGLTQVHTCNGKAAVDAAGLNKFTTPASAYDPTSAGFDAATKEWCPDHGKIIPVAPPDPQAVANGLWYGGTPYLGLQDANPKPLPPGAVKQNPDAGYAYMWHSHNEREITTNNVFPGGLMMMLIIDPPTSAINEMQ